MYTPSTQPNYHETSSNNPVLAALYRAVVTWTTGPLLWNLWPAGWWHSASPSSRTKAPEAQRGTSEPQQRLQRAAPRWNSVFILHDGASVKYWYVTISTKRGTRPPGVSSYKLTRCPEILGLCQFKKHKRGTIHLLTKERMRRNSGLRDSSFPSANDYDPTKWKPC